MTRRAGDYEVLRESFLSSKSLTMALYATGSAGMVCCSSIWRLDAQKCRNPGTKGDNAMSPLNLDPIRNEVALLRR